MWLRPGRTSPGTCQAFMGCRPAGRERQGAGHTARSCSVWLCLSTKSGLAPTNSISLAEPNLVAVDIFKVKNGKVVEHWDVMQEEVPASATASGNPMFTPA